MLEAAQAHPDIVVTKSCHSVGLEHDAFVQELLAHDYLGELREVVVIGADDMFWDYSVPLHWRQDRELSGMNTLAWGFCTRPCSAGLPPSRVLAQSAIFEERRPAARGQGSLPVTVPESVQVLTQLPGGGRGVYHLSGGALFLAPEKQIWLSGQSRHDSHGVYPARASLLRTLGGPRTALIELPDEQKGGWHIEAEFIGAIRGQEQVRYTTFATGVRYIGIH